jgi:hypothetical protein
LKIPPINIRIPDLELGRDSEWGVLVYVLSFLLVLFIVTNAFPGARFTTYTSANLITHLVINGGLIWNSLASKRNRFAQGLIISAVLAVLLDGACWSVVR